MGVIFKIQKDKTKEGVLKEISDQLLLITNLELLNKIKSYLIEPVLHLAIWNYSENKSTYPVWLILKSEIDDTGILFSEYGYDFGNWGLIKLSTTPVYFGTDNNWFETLEEVFLNSWMAEEE